MGGYTSLKYPYQIYRPLLSLEAYQKILKIWKASSVFADIEAVSHPNFGEKFTYKSMKTLSHGNWVNDEIVNGYVRMLNALLKERGGACRVRIVNSFFMGQIVSKDAKGRQRMLNKHEIGDDTTLIIPINKANKHWYFAVLEGGQLTVYDSLPSMSGELVPPAFKEYLRKFHKMTSEKCETSFPQQQNGNDCGVFMMLGMKSLVFQEPDWAFSQEDIPYFRLLIAREILDGRLCSRTCAVADC